MFHPSEMQRLVAGANEAVEKFNQIDAKGISDQLISTTKAMEEMIKGKQMTIILARVDARPATWTGSPPGRTRSWARPAWIRPWLRPGRP